MEKVRLTDDQFLLVLRAALCRKVTRDGTLKASEEIKDKTREVLALKNKSVG